MATFRRSFKVSSANTGTGIFARKIVAAFTNIRNSFFCGVLYVAGTLLINKFGAEGATVTHLVTYVVYFLGMVLYFRKKLF
jgi:PST family polysaccharide transporter